MVVSVAHSILISPIREIDDVCDVRHAAEKAKEHSQCLPKVDNFDIDIGLTDQELDLLALFFTIVKILYVVGSLEVIPLMFPLLGTYDVQQPE